MTAELVDALTSAYSWPITKKTEQWWFSRSERIGKRRALLEEDNWTPWVRIQEYPDKVDILTKIYPTRNREEDTLMQMRQADNPKLVYSMTYNEFQRLMSSVRRWYYEENCDVDYRDEVAVTGKYGENNTGLLLVVDSRERICLSSLFKQDPDAVLFKRGPFVRAIKFSKEFCKQIAFPFCVFGNILAFENFHIFYTNVMKQWKSTEILKVVEQNTDHTGSTEEKTEQKST